MLHKSCPAMRRDAVIKSHNSQGKLQRVYTEIWIQVMAQCTSVLVRESVLSQFSFELRHDKITFVSDFPRAAATAAADTKKINKPREGRERKTESALHFRPGHLFGAEGLTVCPSVPLSVRLSVWLLVLLRCLLSACKTNTHFLRDHGGHVSLKWRTKEVTSWTKNEEKKQKQKQKKRKRDKRQEQEKEHLKWIYCNRSGYLSRGEMRLRS